MLPRAILLFTACTAALALPRAAVPDRANQTPSFDVAPDGSKSLHCSYDCSGLTSKLAKLKREDDDDQGSEWGRRRRRRGFITVDSGVATADGDPDKEVDWGRRKRRGFITVDGKGVTDEDTDGKGATRV